ncbi:Uncharacterised protein [Mycobacterium tuberculosis]|nr:Uncharacterised protein [Mycobacterium tuberculosis]CKU85598.1 Uncharacterised protein [Mycobacterium tuberculosis]
MGPQLVFQHSGGDIFTARGDDNFFLAAGDRQEPVFVHRTEITGLEPAVGECLGGSLLVAPVAAEYHATAHQQLAIVGDA